MKVTTSLVKWFESEQKQYGTKIALHNLLWEVAHSFYADLGVSRVITRYKKAA